MQRPFRLFAALVAILGLVAVACGDDDEESASTAAPAAPTTTEAPTAPEATVSGDITVFAAASLTDAFTEIGEAFGAANPDAKATFNFAASSALVQQITEGAPADVYASADRPNMQKLVDAGGNATEPVVFATNVLEIAVAPGNPKGIATLADLASPDVSLVLCAEQVPCGRFALEVLTRAGVAATPKSLEENVRAVLTKVELGEADAGIVYVTDVLSAGDNVEGVEIPTEQNAVAEYPIAVTKEAGNPDAAAAFAAFVAGPEGQAVLEKYGFGQP